MHAGKPADIARPRDPRVEIGVAAAIDEAGRAGVRMRPRKSAGGNATRLAAQDRGQLADREVADPGLVAEGRRLLRGSGSGLSLLLV